jgi:hypothetical protein
VERFWRYFPIPTNCSGCILVGYGLGGVFAVWRMRNATKRSVVTYADLRQRRLSDYRSDILRWIPLVTMIAVVIFSLIFVPHLGKTLRPIQFVGGALDMPINLLLLWAVPAAMIVVFLIAEFLMTRLARLPRLLITSGLSISLQADDMLRASVIGMVQTLELVAVACLGLLQ